MTIRLASEEFIMECMQNYAGGIAFDIGANIGYYSIYMSSLFEHVYAFEPTRDTIRWLRSNVESLPNVTVVEKAVSHHTGKCKLYPHSHHTAENTISDLYAEGGEDYGKGVWAFNRNIFEIVPCITIDDYVKEIGKAPNFIKCDVEGAEAFLFDGAIETLQKHSPIIALEVHHQRGGVDQKKLYSFFVSHGYKVTAANYRPANEFQDNCHYLLRKSWD